MKDSIEMIGMLIIFLFFVFLAYNTIKSQIENHNINTELVNYDR